MEAESVPVSSGALVFGPKETAGKVTKATHVALMYVKRALASAAPVAVRFQKDLLEDESADPALRFKASEAVLDRFMGKASQEIRLGEAMDRPLVFDSRLKALREGMKAAADVETRDAAGGALLAFSGAVADTLCDREGVTI